MAEQNKEYTKALQMYDNALDVAQQSPELYKEAAILYSNKSNVLYQMNDFKTALTNAVAATNSDPEYSEGYYWSGKALLDLESAVDAFLMFVGGCLKSRNDGDKVLLLTEAAIILNSLSDVDLQSCYEKLHQFNTSVWPDVLTRLSQRAEWKSIAYLILGSSLDVLKFGEINIAESIDQFCTGVAGKSPTAAVETRTVFKYLEQHNGKCIAHWLNATLFVVYSHGGEQTLRNLTVDGRDCPLHAVTRFVLQTERTSLLEVFPHQSPSWCDVSSGGESVFHLLAKHSPPVPVDFLVKVTKSILEKGYRGIMMTDVNGKLPFDLLDITYPMSVCNVFLPNDLREIKMDKLNDRGVSKTKHGDYCGAILLFSKVIDFYRQEAERNSYLYGIILQNRAKSYLQQKEYQRALNDANESMNAFENQESHWIAGRALICLEKYGQACIELLYAYDCVTILIQSRRADIVSYLAKLFSLPAKLHCKCT
ncbi:uncharacterized protein LOC128548444 [Mercenaria mercenaria]|uniref:uncharacterized protein LOC128548444 n=1 Tax=Mercenaria mercenaria TaxID=6596 RepID=UPI00234F436A|nr:uncharacterized protein LOC128548444 [Mercenaria mercenaria]